MRVRGHTRACALASLRARGRCTTSCARTCARKGRLACAGAARCGTLPVTSMVKSCPICGRRAPGGVCQVHGSGEDRRQLRQQVHGRNTAHWRALREQVLVTAGGLCQLRVDEGCMYMATTVHLKPEFDGDHLAATVADCVAACAHCHGVVDGARAARGGGGVVVQLPRRTVGPLIV